MSAESLFWGQVKGAIRYVYEADMANSLTEDIVESLFAVNISIFHLNRATGSDVTGTVCRYGIIRPMAISLTTTQDRVLAFVEQASAQSRPPTYD